MATNPPPITEAEYLNLRSHYFSGVLTVAYEGRSVTYQNLDDMRKVLAEMEGLLYPPSEPLPPNYRLASHRKGV